MRGASPESRYKEVSRDRVRHRPQAARGVDALRFVLAVVAATFWRPVPPDLLRGEGLPVLIHHAHGDRRALRYGTPLVVLAGDREEQEEESSAHRHLRVKAPLKEDSRLTQTLPGLPPPYAQTPLAEDVTRWVIGPLDLRVQRNAQEIQVWTHSDRAQADRPLSIEPSYQGPPLPPAAQQTRFGFAKAPTHLNLRPALADRQVIIRPELPFWVMPGESLTVYVSSPIWVQLSAPDHGQLTDLPTHRPSDTWFGEDSSRGELCYALATRLRLSLGQGPSPHYRALTTVILHNALSDAMNLARLALPTRQLSLWSDPEGRLYTETVTLRRNHAHEPAQVLLGEGPPPQPQELVRITSPRDPISRPFSLRAIESVFG